MMTPGQYRLGPFVLTVPIARGAMGEVWRGVHEGEGVPVAVKVLAPRQGRSIEFSRVFRTEVQRLARMHHPNIVMVLDHGEVPAAAAARSGGRLPEGCPWLAMEYASAGSLAQAPQPTEWGQVSSTLRDLLGALAHAHAHGILHRDIKPENVLLESPLDLRPALKLTDFGIAYALDDEGGSGDATFAGTPVYMAPEQIRGTSRRLGPWTDLYSLGVLAWRLATGRNVFAHTEQGALLRAHVHEQPGRFRPVVAVPEGFESWVRRLLAKDPSARFSCAADAAAALAVLAPDLVAATSSAADTLPASEPTAETWSFDGPPIGDGAVIGEDPSAPLEGVVVPAAPLPTPPRTGWVDAPRLPVRLVGAGLGLYGLRAPPLVGRAPLVERIWRQLRSVWEDGRSRVVVLEGPHGVGKTRLADWIAHRADELGVAVPLRAAHGPTPGRRAGLVGALARLLRCEGLERATIGPHLQNVLPDLGLTEPADARGLAAWLSGRYDPRLLGVPARAALLERLLDGVRRGRPILLLLDDAGWGESSTEVVAHLLAHGERSVPILLLATDSRDPMSTGTAELERLRALPRAETAHVGPLQPDDMVALVRELLVLDEDLARTVAERADGSPLFAVQLVGDWVRRGVLEVAEQGFVVRPGDEALLPADIHLLWQDRVELALLESAASDRRSLWLAAVLADTGGGVDGDEWARTAARVEARPSERLLDALARAGLLVPVHDGFEFAHRLLMESLVQAADEAGEAATLHAAAAVVLAEQPPSPTRDARVGLHRLAAGDAVGALDPLLDGADLAWLHARLSRSRALLARVDQAMAAAAVPPDDPRRGRLALIRLRVALSAGQLGDVDKEASKLAREAKRRRWDMVQAAALRFRGMAQGKSGDLLSAEATLQQALRAATRAGDRREAASCRQHLATLARMRGERDEALEQLEQARSVFRELGERNKLAECLAEVAGVHVTLGDPVRGAEVAEEAARLYAELGHGAGEGIVRNTLGDALRKQGRRLEAVRVYESARDLLQRNGAYVQLFPMLNLGLVLYEAERHEAAVEALVEVLDKAGLLGDRVIQAYARVVASAASAACGDWSATHEHLLAAEGLLGETGVAEPELVRLLGAVLDAAPAHAADVQVLARTVLEEQRAALDVNEA